MEDSLLTLILLLPLLGAATLMLVGSDEKRLKVVAMLFSTATFAVSLVLPLSSDLRRFEVNVPWITAFDLGVRYHVSVDGLSLWLVLLTTLLVPLALLSSWKSISHHNREFLMAVLALETCSCSMSSGK
jgi:NADH-quinone oxidoreductase subunit M